MIKILLFSIDHNNLFSGRVFGALESSVRAHIEDKIITAHIVLPEETYHIEVAQSNSLQFPP